MTTTAAEIWFTTTKSGQRRAYYFSTFAFRALPLPVAVAEMKIATGQAFQITRSAFVA